MLFNIYNFRGLIKKKSKLRAELLRTPMKILVSVNRVKKGDAVID